MRGLLAALRAIIGRLLGYEQELSRMRLVCNVVGLRIRFPGSIRIIVEHPGASARHAEGA